MEKWQEIMAYGAKLKAGTNTLGFVSASSDSIGSAWPIPLTSNSMLFAEKVLQFGGGPYFAVHVPTDRR